MKTAYCFSLSTGEFLGIITAHPSPLEPGKYLLPVNATFDEPPSCGAHEVAVYEGRWEKRPDWRKIELFSKEDGSKRQIEVIGMMPEQAGLTEHPRPSRHHVWKKNKWVEDTDTKAALLASYRAACRAAIKVERDRRKAGGVFCGEKWFHSDVNSRIQHLQLKEKARDRLDVGGSMGDALYFSGEPIAWKTMDGSFVSMTVELAIQLVASDQELDAALFAACEAHIETMMLAADPTQYDFSTGWPDSYA
jgi:hypothetical protein